MLPPCYHAFLLPSWTCILWNINSLYPKFLLIMVFYHSDKLLNFYSEIKLLAAFTTQLRLTVFLCQFCWTKLFSHLFKRHATKKNPMAIWSLLHTRSSYCIALGEEPFSLAVSMCKSWIGFFSLDIFPYSFLMITSGVPWASVVKGTKQRKRVIWNYQMPRGKESSLGNKTIHVPSIPTLISSWILTAA